MASLQTALTARKDKTNTYIRTNNGTFCGTITDDGSVGDCILLKDQTDMGGAGFGQGLVGSGTIFQIAKAHIVSISPQS